MKQEAYTFYLVIPPGFEKAASDELFHKTGLEHDQFQLELSLEDGFSLNHQLRVPTRILLRLAKFKARDFPKLFKKLSNLTWRLWLWSEQVEFHISTSQSRLIHTGRIEAAAKDAIKKSLKAQPFQKKHLDHFDFSPQVHIRIQDDEVTISIDTSYPPLYKRGFDKSGHQASLRENLAYACWLCLKSHIPENNSYNLIDPMCGSGSFLTEALELSQRDHFSYQGFPLTKKMTLINPSGDTSASKAVVNCYGRDNHAKCIEDNKKLFPLISWEQADLFKATPSSVPDGENIIISNPPYNKRIKIDQNMKQIVEAMIKTYSPILMGVIVPRDQISQLHPRDYQLVDSINFRNGGLACQFMIFKRD